MNIIITSSWVWSIPMASQIFPVRLARNLHACGHSVLGFQSEHNWVDEKERGIYKYEWGDCCTVPEKDLLPVMDQTLAAIPKADLMIVANTIDDRYYNLAKKYDIPTAPFLSDPYYQGIPNKEAVKATFEKADVVFCNEGQATEYINDCLGEERAHTINHAYDQTLGPTDEEVKNAEKKYLASICAGIEIQRHAQLMRLLYLPSLNFPEEKFAVAGSMGKRYPPEVMENPKAQLTEEEIKKYTDFDFESIVPLSEPFEKCLWGSQAGVKFYDYVAKEWKPWYGGGLSQSLVHRMYMNSFYGVNPFGSYLYDSPYCRYTFGTKLTEMLGSSAAVICNYIPDIETHIEHGKTGWIIPNDLSPEEQIKKVTEYMQYAVDNPSNILRMGLDARKYTLKYHTWQIRVKQIEKIVKNL